MLPSFVAETGEARQGSDKTLGRRWADVGQTLG